MTVLLAELCVPFLAGCLIGSRVAHGAHQSGLVALVAIPLSLLVSTARLHDRAIIERWYGPAFWPSFHFLGLGLAAVIAGFVLAAIVVVIVEKRRAKGSEQ